MKNKFLILLGGVIFGFGLALSMMVKPEVVLGFLQLDDFGLLATMGTALLVTLPVYQLAPRLIRKPALGASYDRFPRQVAPKHIIGGAIFGIGWGLSGVCPGAGIASIGVGNWPIVFALIGMLIGAYLQGVIVGRTVMTSYTEKLTLPMLGGRTES